MSEETGEAAQIGTGKAAMSLMGQWAPSTFAANAKDKEEVLGDLGSLDTDLPFAELRTISNTVGPRDRGAWRIKDALEALTKASQMLSTTLSS